MSQRPLSPHLGIYRFAHTMALSFAHRASGVALTLGLGTLVYWLACAAAGEQAYERAVTLLSGWFFRLLLLAWLAAFCYHLINGLRHLAWDAGYGLEKLAARRSAKLVLVLALAGLLLFTYLFCCPYRSAP
jgi:succinate dehydrogenase / fumarate reductase cytochrome b subunit